MFAQFAIGGADAAGESFAFMPREAFGKVFDPAGMNTLRFDHDAEHRAKIAGNGVPDVRQQGDHFTMALAAISGREPQPALDRDIDVERARAALARAAEQAGIKYALRGDQHQMAGFVAGVVHGSSSSRGSLAAAMGSTIAEIRCLSPTEGPSFRDDARYRTEWRGLSGPYPWRHILLDAGLAFRRNGALVAVTFLQPGPIGGDIGAEILGEPDIARQAQRITVDDIGRSEPAGAQGFSI